MPPIKPMIGKRFGRLVVIKRAPNKKYPCGRSRLMWECQCDCGNITIVDGTSLRRGITQSCGCLHKEQMSEYFKGAGVWNGDSKNENKRLWSIWKGMLLRCSDSEHYPRYGGRGIKVCSQWHDWFNFKEWSMNNGYQDDLTIDRIDNDKDYTPDNCRWVTLKVQMNNMSTNRKITYHGKTQTLAEWCDELDINYQTTKDRLNRYGYTIEEAFELGKGGKDPRKNKQLTSK